MVLAVVRYLRDGPLTAPVSTLLWGLRPAEPVAAYLCDLLRDQTWLPSILITRPFTRHEKLFWLYSGPEASTLACRQMYSPKIPAVVCLRGQMLLPLFPYLRRGSYLAAAPRPDRPQVRTSQPPAAVGQLRNPKNP